MPKQFSAGRPRSKPKYIVDRGKNFSNNDAAQNEKTKIGYLPEETLSYYRQVSVSIESGFDENDPDSKDSFLNNVFATLNDEGVKVAQNQTGSRILEALFVESKPKHLAHLFVVFTKELSTVYFDRFASHVFQSLVDYLPSCYETSLKEKTETEEIASIKNGIEQLCSFTESHLRDIMSHTYASHVLRSLLEALGGVRIDSTIVRSRLSLNQLKKKDNEKSTVKPTSALFSSDYEKWFNTIEEKLFRLCNFKDHLADPNYSPVLQSLLYVIHESSLAHYLELSDNFLKKTCFSQVKPEGDVEERLPEVVQNDVSSYFIDLLISLSPEEQFAKIYTELFKGNIACFAVHPIANRVLQTFLSHVVNKKVGKEVYTETSQYVEDILAVNHVGVITKVADMCRRLDLAQQEFLEVLMKAFHCFEPEEKREKFVPLVASLQTFEVFFEDQSKPESKTDKSSSCLLKSVNYHGSLILQQLLQYNKPKLLVFGILDLSSSELTMMCCDQSGSHIIDHFFKSSSIWDKSKDAFLKKIENCFLNIGCNKNGSRCLEAIWQNSSVKQRITIAEELAKVIDRLESDRFGRFLFHNFALQNFVNRRKQWQETQAFEVKKHQTQANIVDETTKKKKRKKDDPADQKIDDDGKKELSSQKKKKRKREDDGRTNKEILEFNEIKKEKAGEEIKQEMPDDGAEAIKSTLAEIKQEKPNKKSKKIKLVVDEIKQESPDERNQKKKHKSKNKDNASENIETEKSFKDKHLITEIKHKKKKKKDKHAK